jgi:Protein of unknown function (DUF3383).
MALKDIVEVNITRQTTSVAVAAFNVPLILSQFATNKTTTAFTRARVYGSVAEMASDGWTSSDAVYKIANAIFSQNPSVNKIVVGRKDSNDATIDAALNAIANENNDWYGIVVDQALVSSFADVASWVETAKKFAIFWITDVNAYDPSKSTDLASVLKLANRNRSAVVWHATPAGGADYPDAAWMGEGFPYEPGTSTWAYKTLNGVTPDTLLASQETALKNKNCNYYMTVGGVSITQEGKVASGEYIDIIIGTDWIEARLREAVYSALVNNRKIPYDDTGIAMIEGLVKGVLNEAASKGILQADSIAVTVPKYADIPQADKLARKLPDVKFSALYQGAIHSVTINGTISV